MYKTINVDYEKNRGWRISIERMEIGRRETNVAGREKPISNYILMEDFTSIRGNENDLVRYLELLGVLSFLEEVGNDSFPHVERRRLVIADRVDKGYETTLNSSYQKGIISIPLEMRRFYRPRRKQEKVIGKSLKNFMEDHPELEDFRYFVEDGMERYYPHMRKESD